MTQIFKDILLACRFKNRLLILSFLSFICLHTHAFPSKFQLKNYSTAEGLSHKTVMDIYQDTDGFLWIGTTSGLNRFDGYEFKQYLNDNDDSLSLSANGISKIAEDSTGNLWLATDNGLRYFNKKTERFQKVYFPKEGPFIKIPDVTVDNSGTVWAVSYSYGLFKIDKQSGRFVAQPINTICDKTVYASLNYWHVTAYKGRIWVATSEGLLHIDSETHSDCRVYKWDSGTYFHGMRVGAENELILNSPYEGVLFFDTENLEAKWYKNDEIISAEENVKIQRDILRLPDGTLVYVNSNGVFIQKGEGIVPIELEDYSSFSHLEKDAYVCSYSNGVLWIGTYNNGLFALVPDRSFWKSAYRNSFEELHYVKEFYVFDDQSVLIGSESGVYFHPNISELTAEGLVVLKEKPVVGIEVVRDTCVVVLSDSSFIFHRNSLTLEPQFSTGASFASYMDGDMVLWLGYWLYGLRGYDMATGSVKYINIDTLDRSNNSIYTITGDEDGSLWVGTNGSGLVHIQEPASEHPQLTIYKKDAYPNSVSQNEIIAIHKDRRGNVWVGTCGSGLDVLNVVSGNFTHYTTKNGLKHNVIESIVSDQSGHVWVASNVLSRYDFETNSFAHFTSLDGALDNYMNGTGFCAKIGEIYFAGNNGLLGFNPDSLPDRFFPKIPVLTDIKLFGKTVSPYDSINGEMPYTLSISYSDKLNLPYNINSVAISFASLQLDQSLNVIYEYRVDGIDKQWIPVENKIRTANYSGLQPGEYLLRVRASNGNGNWSDERQFLIEITPPWWKTLLFRIVSLLLLMALGAGAVMIRLRNVQKRNRSLQKLVELKTNEIKEANEKLSGQADELLIKNKNLEEKQIFIESKNQDLSESLKLKDRMLSIISHDFINPLQALNSLLVATSAFVNNSDKNKIYDSLGRAEKMSRNIAVQMQELLDWARGQMSESKYKPVEINLELVLDDAISIMSESALQKQIQISTQLDFKRNSFIDPRMISTVFRNLLSNAVKFTPVGGTILVTIQEDDDMLEVSFVDTGIGLSNSSVEQVFNEGASAGSGTNGETGMGLGLQICKTFVARNNGSITASSKEGEGSVFTVMLPKGDTDAIRSMVITEISSGSKSGMLKDQSNADRSILIVDDNAELAKVVGQIFNDQFKVIIAHDGRAALQLAQNMVPDVIITDFNLPKLSGIEFCKHVKSDSLTNHIPVFIITAQPAEQTELDSYIAGANDYLQKPVDPFVLKQKVLAFLRNRANFKISITAPETEAEIKLPESQENELVQRLVSIIEENYTDPNFGIPQLLEKASLSRTQLWRKLKNSLDKTPGDLIKEMRLKKAAEMVKTGKYRVSEVAYNVGFSDPKYFSKCFVKEYGMNPTEYSKKFG